MTNLDKLFDPRGVAVVGVSQDPTKLGSVLYSNIIEAGYKGKIYPVNPKYDELFGHKSYKSISQIKGSVDLACIAIPAPFVLDTIKDAAKKKVKAAIIITAGFRETGEKGVEMEREIIEVAKKAGIRLLGPNCLGMINPLAKINASFAASTPEEGDVAFLSQSGAFCTAVLDMAIEKQFGFSHFVSLGNKADINENDLIDYWLKDENVKVIGAYLEEINQGQQLMELVQNQKAQKPIIVFKPGESEEAKKAISSHTGSMAGSVQTFRTAVRQNGIIQAKEVNEMFNLMMGFSWAKLPKGKNVAIVTNAGGPGIIATDEIIKAGLKMAKISKESKNKMQENLPATASVANPVDVIGDALAQRYRAPIQVLIEDENVDAIMVILTPQLVTQIEETAKLIINSAKLSDKPIFAVFLGGKYVNNGLQRMYDNKVPAFRYISDAVNVLEAMSKYFDFQNKQKTQDLASKARLLNLAGKGKYHKEVAKLIKEGGKTLPENLVEKIAYEIGLDLPKQIVTSDIEEATKFASMKYPVVIKATTDAIAHKTDLKALYLNISNESQLRKSFKELEATIKSATGKAKANILVQEQIQAKEEVLIGANRDGKANVYEFGTNGFGHLLVFGKGGIYTEVYKDINYALVPSTREQIDELLSETKIDMVLRGFRGLPELAREEILDTIEQVQKLVIMYPEIESLDLNPILVNEKRAVAVDVKVFVS